jgi:starvation-inducible DNA-binding protein
MCLRSPDLDRAATARSVQFRGQRDDNKTLLGSLRDAHAAASEHGDVTTTGLLENWIDEAEERVWFLFETSRTLPH